MKFSLVSGPALLRALPLKLRFFNYFWMYFNRYNNFMKRVLNLNHQGAQMIALIILFGLLIPGILWLLGTLFLGRTALLSRLMYASLIIGGLLLAGFVVLLILEQIQDHLLYRAYRQGLGQRIPLAGGGAECPYCGCRQVHDYEAACPVCHKTLR